MNSIFYIHDIKIKPSINILNKFAMKPIIILNRFPTSLWWKVKFKNQLKIKTKLSCCTYYLIDLSLESNLGDLNSIGKMIKIYWDSSDMMGKEKQWDSQEDVRKLRANYKGKLQKR